VQAIGERRDLFRAVGYYGESKRRRNFEARKEVRLMEEYANDFFFFFFLLFCSL
jgi:hypothetical protein